MKEEVILVSDQDQAIGSMEKIAAHEQGLRHRAFSIFVSRKRGDEIEFLLQKRADEKYHCGGLWTNTCCGHPRPGENIVQAGTRRLKEEFGFNVELKEIGVFHYIAELDNELTENEIDHVLLGEYNDETIQADPSEIADYQWMSVNSIKAALADEANEATFTPWFKEAFEVVASRKYVHG